jgi:hypothetical protein
VASGVALVFSGAGRRGARLVQLWLARATRIGCAELQHQYRAQDGGCPSSHALNLPGYPAAFNGGLLLASSVGIIALMPQILLAHVLAAGDKGYVLCTEGLRLVPFAYLGAKHMVTGYDHLLFLVGVIFFLYRLRDTVLYVTLFAVGHTVTLLAGVLGHVAVNPYLIDAIIGFSVVYKGLDNLGALKRVLGFQPSTRASTMLFGLCHGLGLASKLIDFELAGDGVVANLLAFNVGVEVGQVLALTAILVAMGFWRRTPSFVQHASAANVVLIAAGLVLVAYQVAGLLNGGA